MSPRLSADPHRIEHKESRSGHTHGWRGDTSSTIPPTTYGRRATNIVCPITLLVCQPEYTECQPATDHRFLDITLHIAPQEWFSRQELEIEDLPEALVGPYLIAFHPSRLIRGSDQRLHPHQLHADGLRGFQRKEAL